jgi:hypothetical protein
LARIGDTVRVVLTTEGDGHSCLCWLVDMSTVGPPKMRKTFSTAGKPSAPPSPAFLLASSSFAATRL